MVSNRVSEFYRFNIRGHVRGEMTTPVNLPLVVHARSSITCSVYALPYDQ